MKKAFTLIELLVTVAIIAVIGAGVAVTYNRLDTRAKIAMEVNDCGTLSRLVAQWSFLHDGDLPNRLDSLIGTDGTLYSQVSGYSGVSPANGRIGLCREAGFTFMAASAPSRLISNLAEAGLDLVYLHRTDAVKADDSTYSTGVSGSDVDTLETLVTLASGASERRDAAEALMSTQSDGLWWDYDSDGPFTYGGASYATLPEYQNALRDAREILLAREADTLAFIYPGGGYSIGGVPSELNITANLIADLGFREEDIASPDEGADDGKACWLVVFGLGRFASICDGRGVRLDAPATGKLHSDNDLNYSRYLAVVRVPTARYSAMNGNVEAPRVVGVLSPQGCTAAMLERSYSREVQATDN